MVQISALSIIYLNIFVLCVKSWVLTDVDLRDVMRMAVDDYEDDYIEEDEDDITLKFNLIYPGTKWCGVGSIAENYNDLGSERETDLCCRDHDNCPDYINPGETKFNLTNDAYYSRMSCQCDEEFRKCLRTVHKNSQSTVARNLGYIYFNGLQTKCFRNDYPVVRCLRTGGWLSEKCLEYEYDTSSTKRYQWFHVRNY